MSCHEMRIMTLGSPDAGVPEQHLDGAQIGAAGQQLDGEGVAGAVRVSVDAGELAEALQGAAEIAGARADGAGAGPKEVVWVAAGGGQSAQGGDRVRMELYFHPHTVLQCAEHQVPVRLQSGTAQGGDVGDAQAGIEQCEEEGARPLADVRSFGGIVARDLGAGLQQTGYLIGGEGLGDESLLFGQAEPARRVLLDEAAVEAPEQKSLDALQFLALGRGLHLALLTVPREQVEVDSSEGTIGAGELGKMTQHQGIDLEGGLGQVAGAAVGEEAFDGLAERDGLTGLGQPVGSRKDERDARGGAGPIVGAEGDAAAEAVGVVVFQPHGAGAQGVGARAVRAGREVAAVGQGIRIHASAMVAVSGTRNWYTKYSQRITYCVINRLDWRKPVGVGVPAGNIPCKLLILGSPKPPVFPVVRLSGTCVPPLNSCDGGYVEHGEVPSLGEGQQE